MSALDDALNLLAETHGAGAVRAARAELGAMKQALRDLREVAFDGPSEAKGTGCAERYREWRERIARETAQWSTAP